MLDLFGLLNPFFPSSWPAATANLRDIIGFELHQKQYSYEGGIRAARIHDFCNSPFTGLEFPSFP